MQVNISVSKKKNHQVQELLHHAPMPYPGRADVVAAPSTIVYVPLWCLRPVCTPPCCRVVLTWTLSGSVCLHGCHWDCNDGPGLPDTGKQRRGIKHGDDYLEELEKSYMGGLVQDCSNSIAAFDTTYWSYLTFALIGQYHRATNYMSQIMKYHNCRFNSLMMLVTEWIMFL